MKKVLLSFSLSAASILACFAQETTHVSYEWDFDNPTDYENGETLPEGWTTTGTNLFSRADAEYYGLNPANSGNYLVVSASNNATRDEALYTKMLNLKGGVEYTLNFYLKTGYATPVNVRTTGIKVTAGSAQNADSQSIDILDTGKTYSFGEWTNYNGKFTPETDGEYCVCFSLYTSMARCGDVAFDDISIEGDEPASAAGGDEVVAPSEITVGTANAVTSDVVQNYDGIMNFYYKNSKSTFMYTAEQLGIGASKITKIVVPFAGGSKSYDAAVKIWMQNSESATSPETLSEEGMTLVFDNENYTIPFTGNVAENGEMVFELSEGFDYTGKSLVIHFAHSSSSYQGTPQIVYPIETGVDYPTFYCGRSDMGLDYINDGNMYPYSFVPVVKFTTESAGAPDVPEVGGSEVTVGKENAVTSSVVQNYDGIMNFYYKNSKSTFMYTAEQLGIGASSINKIVVPFYGGSKSYDASVKIWMENTDSVATPETVNEEGMTLVYSNEGYTIPFTGDASVAGEMVFEFPEGFEYTGKSLVVHFAHSASSYQGTPQIVYPIESGAECPTFYCGRTDMGLDYINDNNLYSYSFVPVVKFGYGAVAEKSASIAASQATISLGEVGLGESVSRTIKVTGVSLKDDIIISEPNSQAVSVSVAKIAKDDAMAVGGAELTITVSPTDEQTTSAVITLSSTGCEDVEILVNWEPVVLVQDGCAQIGSISGKTQTAEVNGTSASDAPLNFLFKHSKSEFVYTADDLQVLGENKAITKLSFPVYGGGRDITAHIKIWLLNTDQTTPACFTDVNEMEKVLDKVSYSVVATASENTKGWLEFELENPFNYSGKNLLVVMESESDEYMMPNMKWGVDTSKEGYTVNHRRGDSDTGFNGEYGTWSYNYFPVVKINFEDQVISGIEGIKINNNDTVTVYDMNGRCLSSKQNIDEAFVNLNSGLYIAKVGNKVYKINVSK